MGRSATSRIDLLHYAAPPVVGGVESVIEHHARLMHASGYQVRILAGRGSQLDADIPFISLPMVDSLHPDILEARSCLDAGEIPANFEGLVEAIYQRLAERTKDTDLLIAHNVTCLPMNLALTAALYRLSQQLPKPRLIRWQHDLAWTTPRYQPVLYPGYPWDLLRTAWPGVNQVTVSDERRDELVELMGISKEQVQVIPNGVDLATFFKLEQKTVELVRKMNLLAAAPILLLPVRLIPRKNIEFALQVLAVLKGVYSRPMLVITGPLGAHNPANISYFERLKSLRSELSLHGLVHFLAELDPDYLPDPVIADFYRLADALFIPSTEEGFGIPLLEAGISGLPVFCSDIPPFRELGDPSKDGQEQVNYFSLHAPPGQVAEQIHLKLACSREYSFRLRCRQEFTWDSIYQAKIAPLLESS